MPYEADDPFRSKNDPYSSNSAFVRNSSGQGHYHIGVVANGKWTGCGCDVNVSLPTTKVNRRVDLYVGGIGVGSLGSIYSEGENIVLGGKGNAPQIFAARAVLEGEKSEGAGIEGAVGLFNTGVSPLFLSDKSRINNPKVRWYSPKKVEIINLNARKSGVLSLIPASNSNIAGADKKVKKIGLIERLLSKQ